jgi:hypothetical protein
MVDTASPLLILCLETVLEYKLKDVAEYHQHFLLNLSCAVKATLLQVGFQCLR